MPPTDQKGRNLASAVREELPRTPRPVRFFLPRGAKCFCNIVARCSVTPPCLWMIFASEVAQNFRSDAHMTSPRVLAPAAALALLLTAAVLVPGACGKCSGTYFGTGTTTIFTDWDTGDGEAAEGGARRQFGVASPQTQFGALLKSSAAQEVSDPGAIYDRRGIYAARTY